ncbi:MAG: hypothetical protein L0Z48_07430 [candidate division Zixibacteria bacterium]|nr:hypothetical protein [candidate division Zixibacteria bacterium]
MSVVISCRLIEPEKISEVQVEEIQSSLAAGKTYKVTITGNNPYRVSFSDVLLNSTSEHGGYLKSPENRAYTAIRARNKLTGNEIIIGYGDWAKYQLRKIGTDLTRDEAESVIIKLIVRATKEPDRPEWTFRNWDLKASLDFEDFERILLFYKEQVYLRRVGDGDWKVTRDGFRYFEERVRQENMPLILNVNRYFQRVPIRTKKPFVFVMMPFREEECPQTHFTDCIKPTVKEVSNYDCIRADEDHEPGKIDNKIWTLIQEAEFIIAEITYSNPNVILELGMALTFGKPVYPFTRRPQQETLSIDNKTLLAEQYSDAEDLKRKLTKVLPKK